MSGTIAGNPWPSTDRSGTIATGGAAQVLMSANTQRRGFSVQNVSSGDLWFSAVGTAAASQPSFRLPPNAMYENPYSTTATTEISIFGATTGQAFSAREW